MKRCLIKVWSILVCATLAGCAGTGSIPVAQDHDRQGPVTSDPSPRPRSLARTGPATDGVTGGQAGAPAINVERLHPKLYVLAHRGARSIEVTRTLDGGSRVSVDGRRSVQLVLKPFTTARTPSELQKKVEQLAAYERLPTALHAEIARSVRAMFDPEASISGVDYRGASWRSVERAAYYDSPRTPAELLLVAGSEEDRVQALVSSGQYLMVGELDLEALRTAAAARDERARQAQQERAARRAAEAEVASNRSRQVMEQLRTAEGGFVGILFPEQVGRDSGACAITTSDGQATVAQAGYLFLETFAKARNTRRESSFSRQARDVDDAYRLIQRKACSAIVLSSEDARVIVAALERDKQLAYLLHGIAQFDELERSFAQSRGFEDLEDYRLGSAVKASPRQVAALRSRGVSSVGEWRQAIERMVRIGYAQDTSAQTVVQFLQDEADARERKSSALALKKAREERAAAEEQQRRAAIEKQRLARAKESPYIAVLTCGMPNHINILACFAGSRGLDTELVITRGASSTLYKAYNLRSAGEERRDGFYIDLPPRFTLRAQNSDDTLILGLRIIDRLSGNVVYQSQAARFGVVRARD
jgi:hypothetical protein